MEEEPIILATLHSLFSFSLQLGRVWTECGPSIRAGLRRCHPRRWLRRVRREGGREAGREGGRKGGREGWDVAL